MSQPYDPNKYRALGVGETVRPHHYTSIPGLEGVAQVHSLSVGWIVDGTEEVIYLELLPVAVLQEKDVYPTGGARSSSAGRGRFDLLPWQGMLALARRYEYGAERFGAQNWRKGVPLSRILSSLRRHSSQVGYDFTEDHAAAVAWNAFAWITMVEDVRAGLLPREIDDLGVIDKEVAR